MDLLKKGYSALLAKAFHSGNANVRLIEAKVKMYEEDLVNKR
jgi:hypothetical protein